MQKQKDRDTVVEQKEKNKRLAELNALLNLDDKETVLLEENEFCNKSPIIERINRKKTEYER